MSRGPHEATALPLVAVGALAAIIGLKVVIWFGCIRIKTTQVQVLAQGLVLHLVPRAVTDSRKTIRPT
jgi:hypothetical protein